ncbi:GNAT family N-acetyltransferase [Tatumella sp. OPLPL6]|uniref:GNAT family N-acetyltransferase n=1 Tax=Tatumella sp. OPLPL6 TaxID=1928657 RepID=UPI000C190543|nr:GNAT family N-acetyltransferase [Tatumella sp. OPLPL6]PIJ45795.1 hypothetical protein BOM24_02155 [Tatumella sp. OPLPL6]
MNIQLRTMHHDDLSQGFRLSQQVNWPHRLDDWEQALSLGEGIVAQTEQAIVGCAVLWPWGEQRSTLGLVIVDAAYQGQGIGKLLMEGLLEKVPEATIRLHATEMGKGLYEKYGFKEKSTIFQHQIAQLPTISVPELVAGELIRSLKEEELATLIEHDFQSHGLHRPTLWQNLFESADIWVLEKSKIIQGYVAVRQFGRGYVIGPLLAHDENSAQKLFCYGASSLTGKFVRVDTHGNTDFSDWLVQQGLPCIDAPIMMIRGEPWSRPEGAMSDYSFMSQAMG